MLSKPPRAHSDIVVLARTIPPAELRFPGGLNAGWILLLRKGSAEYFHHLRTNHALFAIQSCRLGCSLAHPSSLNLAMFRDTHMGPTSPRLERYQFGGTVVSVSCSIATVTRRQIVAPA